MWDLGPQPGIEPMPPAVEAQSLHWIAREVLDVVFELDFYYIHTI